VAKDTDSLNMTENKGLLTFQNLQPVYVKHTKITVMFPFYTSVLFTPEVTEFASLLVSEMQRKPWPQSINGGA
jgi:hypothetical protein